MVSTCAVAVAAAGFGSVPLFAKPLTEAGISPIAIAFFRYLLVGLALLPALRLRRLQRKATLWALAAGAAMGLGWTGYVCAIELMPVSTVAILYMTYPFFTVLVAWIAFAQLPTGRSVVASGLIVMAAALVVTPANSINWTSAGVFYALAAPLTFGLAVNILATKLEGIPPLSRVAGLGTGAVMALAPLVSTLPTEAVLPGSPVQCLMVAGICLVTALAPQLLYVIHSPRIGAAKSAMLGGLELPTMLLIGWCAFAEPVLSNQVAGAALVLGAISLTPSSRQPSATDKERINT